MQCESRVIEPCVIGWPRHKHVWPGRDYRQFRQERKTEYRAIAGIAIAGIPASFRRPIKSVARQNQFGRWPASITVGASAVRLRSWRETIQIREPGAIGAEGEHGAVVRIAATPCRAIHSVTR